MRPSIIDTFYSNVICYVQQQKTSFDYIYTLHIGLSVCLFLSHLVLLLTTVVDWDVKNQAKQTNQHCNANCKVGYTRFKEPTGS